MSILVVVIKIMYKFTIGLVLTKVGARFGKRALKDLSKSKKIK